MDGVDRYIVVILLETAIFLAPLTRCQENSVYNLSPNWIMVVQVRIWEFMVEWFGISLKFSHTTIDVYYLWNHISTSLSIVYLSLGRHHTVYGTRSHRQRSQGIWPTGNVQINHSVMYKYLIPSPSKLKLLLLICTEFQLYIDYFVYCFIFVNKFFGPLSKLTLSRLQSLMC